MYATDELRVSNVVLVDNRLGITLSTVNSWKQPEVTKLIKLSDSFIYGENNDMHDDCPDGASGTTGEKCYCPDKFGFMTFYSLNKGKDAHITEKAARPLYNTKSFANWSSKALISNVNFINFKTQSKCVARISAIGMPDKYQPDYNPVHYFTNTKFTNVAQDAVAFLRDPPLSWASINDCGEWPCTGPSNAIFNFYDSVWEVNDGVTALPDFWKAGTTKYSF